jgi:SpoIID/LytB domain protein
MLRRLSTLTVVLTAALAMAAPAQGTTLFTLIGHGWGHGIGMSQWGALGYAQHGWGYRDILGHYYTDTGISTLPSTAKERVLMASNLSAARFGSTTQVKVTSEGSNGATHTLPAGSYRIEPGPQLGYTRIWGYAAGKYVLTGLKSPVRVDPGGSALRLDETTFRGFSGDHWHGSFRFVRQGSAIAVIDVVGLDGYARGIVPCEMSASWLLAALQVQAVAARSYAWGTRNPGGLYDATDGTSDQTYCPIEREGTTSIQAVTSTSRQIVTYHGSVAVTFYSASSGGRTSSEQASWYTQTGPAYLVPVADPYDSADGQNPNHTWPHRVFTPDGLAARFGTSGGVLAVDHTIDAPSLRVMSLALHKSDGTTVNRTASQAFSQLALKSTYFRLLGVTLNAPLHATAGVPFNVSGRAWPKPIGGVKLQYRLGTSTTWVTATTAVQLDADGRFTVPRKNAQIVSFRLIRADAVSPVVKVGVHPAMTLVAGQAGFHGSFAPYLAGASVHLQRNSSGTWVTRETAPVDPGGSFSFNTDPSPGQWRVWFDGDATHASGGSASLTLDQTVHVLVALG